MDEPTVTPELLCASGDLVERGRAWIWDLQQYGQPVRAFAMRFEGRVVMNLVMEPPTPPEPEPEPKTRSVNGKSNTNRAPWPGELNTEIWPSIAAASSWLIANPRPLPP